MNPWIVVAWMVTAGSVAVLAAAFGWTWFGSRKSSAGSEDPERDAKLAVSFGRFQVMERLLSPRDLQFLSSQPGYTAQIEARWKRNSVHIFRLYLSELTRDFHALHAHARRLVVESHSESPELASTLLRQQVAFWRARMVLEVRLSLFSLGIGGVEAAPLLAMIEAMRIDLGRVVPEIEPAL